MDAAAFLGRLAGCQHGVGKDPEGLLNQSPSGGDGELWCGPTDPVPQPSLGHLSKKDLHVTPSSSPEGSFPKSITHFCAGDSHGLSQECSHLQHAAVISASVLPGREHHGPRDTRGLRTLY